MATSDLLPLIIVLVTGCLGAEYGWPPGKEFAFSIQGESMAGLPQLKQQYAGFRYQGMVRVQTHSPRVLLVKMSNMNYTKIHEELTNGWWRGPDFTLKNKTKSFPITTSTIVVKLTKSTSPELVIQSGLEDWQVNFIKGLVSNLLTYLGENSDSGPNSNRLSSGSTSRQVFSVMEDSVVGRCETLYEVTPLPKMMALQRPNSRMCEKQQQMYEVIKSRNYSNCQMLSEDHAHLPTRDCTPGGANCGNFWTRSSLTQMIGCGEKNNFLLLSSVSVSVINTQLHLQNNSQAVINSNVNITLISALELRQKFNPPQNKDTVKTLLYSYSLVPKGNTKNAAENSISDESQSQEEDNNDRQNQRGNNKKNNKYPKKQRGNSNSNEDNSRDESKNRNRKESNKEDRSTSGPRERRSLGKKFGYRRNSGFNDNFNDNSGTDDSTSGKQWNKNSFQPKINKRKNTSWQISSEESDNQPSEELQLEDQWKISGREEKNVPPHQPFHLFNLAHRTSYDLSCLNPKLRQVVADIASDLQDTNIMPEKHTPAKLSLAVDICRSLPLDQLQAVSEEVFEVHTGAMAANNQRKVYRDVVTMCGTHPALQLLRGWVERQQVDGKEAADIIAAFPSRVFAPTIYLVQDFFEMTQQLSKSEDKQVVTAAVLALSNLVRDACASKTMRTQHFSSIVRPVCDTKMAARVMEWFRQQLDSDPKLTRAYITAIGNLNLPEVLTTLRDIALNPKYSTYLQTSAVFAMRYQALRGSPAAQDILLSLFHNYTLPVSSRVAAVALLLYSEPGLTVWQTLAISTYYEPSWAVSQYVTTSLRSLAMTHDSRYSHMSKSALLVQPLSRAGKVNSRRAFNMVRTQSTDDLQRLVLEQFSSMPFYDFNNLYYRHTSRDSGFIRTNLEASLVLTNPDDLWMSLREAIGMTEEWHSRPRGQGAERSLSWIQQSLDLYSRSMPKSQAEIHFKVNHMLEQMYLVDSDTVKSWAKEGRKMVLEGLTRGKSFRYMKADMDCFYISTTTEMGFPVEFAVQTPWLVNAMAQVNVSKEGLHVQSSFTYSSQLLSSVSVMSGWDNIAHSAGAHATNFAQLPPLRLTASLDNSTDAQLTPSEAIKVTTSYVDQHRLVYFAMQPYTSQRKLKVHQPALLSPDTLMVKLGEPVQMPISWLNHYLNTIYSTEEKENFNPMDLFRKSRTVVGFPMLMPNMEARSFETVMHPIHPVVMNFSMSTASKSMGLLELEPPKDTMMGKLFKFGYKLFKGGRDVPSGRTSGEEDFGDMPKGKKDKNSNRDRNQATTEENADSQESTTKNPRREKDTKDTNRDRKDKNKNKWSSNEDSSNSTEQRTTTAKTLEKIKMASSTAEKRNKYSSEEDDDMDSNDFSVPDFKVYSTTYESLSGNFNASQTDPFANTVNGSSHSYLIGQILDKITSGKAVVFGFKMMSTNPEQTTNMSAYAAYAATYSDRAHRVGFFLNKGSTQMRMTLAHEDPIDLPMDLKKRVNEDLMHKVFVDYIFKSSGKDMKATLKAKLGASRRTIEQLMNSPLLENCSQMVHKNSESNIDPKCQDLTAQAKEIGFGNITIHYNDDAKTLEKYVGKYMNAAQVVLPWTEELPGKGSNTMEMSMDVNPRTQSVDAFLTTPNSSLNIYKYPMSKLPFSSVVEWATQISPTTEFCGLTNQQVRTFDNAEFQYKMKDNWHLVMKDCSNKYGISVIAQPAQNNSMMVEVNIDDKFIIMMEEGPKVTVNNKLQQLDESHALMMLSDHKGNTIGRVVHTPDHTIHMKLSSYKLDLVYAQSFLTIKGQEGLQGRLCGLCGSYSNSGVEKFLTAHGSEAGSTTEFAGSYQLHDSKPERSH